MSELEKKQTTNLELFQGESGFEETSADTFKTPFVRILQSGSPERKKADAKYVEGAEEGLFFNTATKQLYENIEGIILKVVHNLVVWKPERGGFVGAYKKSEENNIVAKVDGPRKWDKDGNDIDDTISFYFMNVHDPMDIFILPVSKTSFKHGRSFATRLRALKVDGKPVQVSWAGVWTISSKHESNDKGDWYSMGDTPKFQRIVTADEVNNFIKPAIELLKTAQTDFSKMEDDKSDSGEDNVEF